MGRAEREPVAVTLLILRVATATLRGTARSTAALCRVAALWRPALWRRAVWRPVLRGVVLCGMVLCGMVLAPAVAGAHAGAGTLLRDPVILGAVGNSRAETQERERETGRPLEGVRAFKRWDERLIGPDQRWAARKDRTLFLSVKSRRLDGSVLSWRDIADAAPGTPLHADLLRQAQELKSFHRPVYLVFNHEPDAKTSRPMGEPAGFVAAWRRVVSTYRLAGVRNARYVWTMTDQAFQQGTAGSYYPGDAYVDAIGVDAYNWYDCRGGKGQWKDLAELIEPHRRFGLEHAGKDLMVLEWGSVEDRARPGRKAQWIRDAAKLFTRPGYRRYRAILHWDDRYTGQGPGRPCDFDYRTSGTSLRAWRAMAAAVAYNPVQRRPAARPWSSVIGLAVLPGCGAIGLAGTAWLLGRRNRRTRTAAPPSTSG